MREQQHRARQQYHGTFGGGDLQLKVGDQASLVVLDASNTIEALRLRPDRLAVVSKGRVVAERHRNDCCLDLASRPQSVRRRL